MADKKGRIGTLVSKDLADIIWELNPDLTNLASVNEVVMNYDNSVAKVYVSHLQEDKIDDLVLYLNNHKGVVRSRLASKLDIYKVPELYFYKDTLQEEASKIDSIIASWHKDDKPAKKTKKTAKKDA